MVITEVRIVHRGQCSISTIYLNLMVRQILRRNWNWDSLNRPTLLGEKVGLSVISDKSQKGDSWRHIETAEESHLKGKVEESQTHFTEPALISVISYLVLETFSKSSSERVPSEVRHCRITSDIFTKEFLTSRQPWYTVWRLVED